MSSPPYFSNILAWFSLNSNAIYHSTEKYDFVLSIPWGSHYNQRQAFFRERAA